MLGTLRACGLDGAGGQSHYGQTEVCKMAGGTRQREVSRGL